MIEVTVLQYLANSLDVPCYMERPATEPESYVIISKTGSGRENRINKATFAIQSYAPSMYAAALLNEQVKIAMDAIIDTENVSKSALNSDYNYTNTTDKSYRYQAVYDLVY